METRELPLMGRLDGPSAVPLSIVRRAETYRQAVRLSYALSRVKKTHADLARDAQLTPQHVSDYLAKDDKPGRRDLPAAAVRRWEYDGVGNTLVSQWLAWQSSLTVLEEMQATRAAA